MWDVASGEKVLSLAGHSGIVWDVAFSPDGKLLATVGDDSSTRLWDAATGEEVLNLTGHSSGIYEVAFSPDGTRLATAGSDGTARIYVIGIDQLVDLARARLTRSWTEDECRRYTPSSGCPAAA